MEKRCSRLSVTAEANGLTNSGIRHTLASRLPNYQLHLLFDEIAEEIEPFIDLLAERATSLGGYATGTARMASEHSALPEYPTEAIEGRDHLEALIERFAIYVGRIRAGSDAANDLGAP